MSVPYLGAGHAFADIAHGLVRRIFLILILHVHCRGEQKEHTQSGAKSRERQSSSAVYDYEVHAVVLYITWRARDYLIINDPIKTFGAAVRTVRVHQQYTE